MQIISNVALISINETLVFQLVSFLIFLFIINRIMFRPLRETMRERENYISRLNQDILGAKEELEAVIEQTKMEEDTVRTAAFKVCEALEKSANREAGDILQAARAEIASMSEKSREDVASKVDEARKAIGREAEAIALSVMEKVLERKVAQ